MGQNIAAMCSEDHKFTKDKLNILVNKAQSFMGFLLKSLKSVAESFDNTHIFVLVIHFKPDF